MPNILDKIVDTKREELRHSKIERPFSALESYVKSLPTPLNLSGALMGDNVRLIAEAKKASPSKGLLRADYNPVDLANIYASNGAAAMSVLTETNNFQGSLDHLESAAAVMRPLGIPILRKDFIFDPYQIYESRAHGADAVLLIVSILSRENLSDLLAICKSLWLQVLTEVHNEKELALALSCGCEIIGINNRNLKTFETNLSTTIDLAPKVPAGHVLVSESGINQHSDLVRLGRLGINAVLVGEAIVTAPDPGHKIKQLLHDLN